MIWTAITAIIPWGWIAGALGAAVAIAGAWIAGKRSGAVAARNKATRKRAEGLGKAIDVRSATDAKSDAAVRGDLGGWVRPGDQ